MEEAKEIPKPKRKSGQRGPGIKESQKAKWRAEYIEGCRTGLWATPMQYWMRALEQAGGISRASLWKIAQKDAWSSAGRMVMAESRHADVVEEQTKKRMKLVEDYQKTGELASKVLKRVNMALKPGAVLNPGDLKRLSETIAKSHETLSLALDRPTSINGGVPTVSIQYYEESAPYQHGDGVNEPLTVDAESHAVESPSFGSERGSEDTQDRPVPEVGVRENPDVAVQGGGLVSLPVLPTGEDGSVETADRYVGEPADKTDSGKAE